MLRLAIPSAGDVRSHTPTCAKQRANKPPHKHENQLHGSVLDVRCVIPEDLLSHFWQKLWSGNDKLDLRRHSPAWLEASI